MPGWITSKKYTICKNSSWTNGWECPLIEAAHAPQGNLLTIKFSKCCRNYHLRGPYGSARQRQLWSLTKYIYSSTVLKLIFKYLYFAQVFPYSATLGSHTAVTLHFDATVHLFYFILDSSSTRCSSCLDRKKRCALKHIGDLFFFILKVLLNPLTHEKTRKESVYLYIVI